MFRKSAILAVLFFIAFGVGFILGTGGLSAVYAQSFDTYVIDQSWGPVRGSLGNRILIFEDSGGTVRFVDISKFDLSTKKLEVERVLERQ